MITPQQYIKITRAAAAIREARAGVELAKLHVEHADACYSLAMREAGLVPTVPHRFDDSNLTIVPVDPPSE